MHLNLVLSNRIFRATALVACIGILTPALMLAAEATGSQAQQILALLNQVVQWRRDTIAESQLADHPGDLAYTGQNQANADQITRLVFQYARSEAQAIAPTAPSQTEVPTSGGASKNLDQLLAQAQSDVASTQKERDDLQSKTLRTPAERASRDATVQELNAELDLANARVATLKQLAGFAQSTSRKSGTLLQQIEQLQRSVTGLFPTQHGSDAAQTSSEGAASGTNQTASQTAAQTASQTASQTAAQTAVVTKNSTQGSGIIGLSDAAMNLARKMSDLNGRIQATQALQATVAQLRAPIVTDLNSTLNQASTIEKQADTADNSTLALQRQQLDSLTAKFKEQSSALVPLGEADILLSANALRLQDWRATVKREYDATLRSLGTHLTVLGIAIILLLAFSELWKRATFRYVHDLRRRAQFLLLRRIIMGIIIIFVVVVALVTQAGSVATYAGFVTAGLAVALQNVILSVVAYFFLIGRYGLHVGDRVTISGVTGDVMEIGLVRMHLLEVSGAGNDVHPTGRSVVFSNAVILQPATSLFKQVPGSDFVWHEVSLTLAPNTNYIDIEKKLMAAVMTVVEKYRPQLHAQKPAYGMRVDWSDPQPRSRLRLTDSGLEIVIRYPVELGRSAVIDDQITRVVLDTIRSEPEIRLVPPTAPTIQVMDPVATKIP